MIYVMSDIHGETDRFHQMLSTIAFSESDTLYIIGDVIDRSSSGIELLLEIIDTPNIHMLLGNHEQMMLDVFEPNSYPDARKLWAQNGGNVTRRELIYHRTTADRQKVLRYCRSLPLTTEVEAGGRSFTLVHGYPAANPLDQLWGRVAADSVMPLARAGSPHTFIVGHTPTCFLTDRFHEPYQIFHGVGFIDIDCGCGNMTNPYRRLACLRLDDMKEFYC